MELSTHGYKSMVARSQGIAQAPAMLALTGFAGPEAKTLAR
jgi:hypothetical protein